MCIDDIYDVYITDKKEHLNIYFLLIFPDQRAWQISQQEKG